MTPGTTTLAETDSHFLCRHGVEVRFSTTVSFIQGTKFSYYVNLP